MSSTNKTAHYELPQFVENDIFNPLVDDNDAYEKIDAALYNIANAEADDAAEIVGIKSRLDTTEGKVEALETQNGTDVLTTVAQTLSGAVNELKSGEDSLDSRLDVVEGDINNVSTGLKAKVTALETQNGSEVLETTAQTLSGAINEIHGIIGNGVSNELFADLSDAIDKLDIVVTPEMYGAIGDGNNDDTTAFQAALDSGKIVMCLPNSVYKITSVLRVKANTTIILNGATVSTTNPHLFFNFLDDDVFTGYTGNGNIIIKDGNIVGGSIGFWHCENVKIENVNFKNCVNNHWIEVCAAKNFVVSNCSFIGMAGTTGLEYINIDPCPTTPVINFTGVIYPSGNYDGTKVDGLYIHNNLFDIGNGDYAHMTDAIGCHSPMGQFHNDIQIVNNTIRNFDLCAIRLTDMENSIIEGNFMESNLNTERIITMSKDAGDTYSNKNCIIINNTLRSAKYGIQIADAYSLVVKNNVFEPLDGLTHPFSSLSGNTKYLTLTGNDFIGARSALYVNYDEPFLDKTDVFEICQKTSLVISNVNDVITVNSINLTEFDTIYLEYGRNNTKRVFPIYGDNVTPIVENVNLPVVFDPLTQDILVRGIIDATDKNVISLFSNAASAVVPTISGISVEKQYGVAKS